MPALTLFLSSYFVFVAFSGLIKGAEANNQIIGIQCARAYPRVTRLFFANDYIIFHSLRATDSVEL